MNKKFKSGIIILIVMIIVVLAALFGTYFISGTKDSHPVVPDSNYNYKNYDPQVAKEYKNLYIASVYLEGTIEESNTTYNQDWILSTIESLKNDQKNAALALYINSPGGAVYQADEVYLSLLEYKNSGKQIYVYQGPMAASGGYYISCAANEIWANRNTLTGSIGVISGTSIDVSDLLANLGIKSETIHSGKNKNMGNYNEPLTDEQREILQQIGDECYEQFCSIVVANRHISFNDIYKIADGRVYTATQAKNLGLIDHIGSYEEMLNSFSYAIGKPGIKVVEMKYKPAWNFSSWFNNITTSIFNKTTSIKTGIPESVLESQSFNSYPAYILK